MMKFQPGFTLIETLVALVIATIASAQLNRGPSLHRRQNEFD
jgi:prepilin-type N-terminal cleavage/methylation domain-containing protein